VSSDYQGFTVIYTFARNVLFFWVVMVLLNASAPLVHSFPDFTRITFSARLETILAPLQRLILISGEVSSVMILRLSRTPRSTWPLTSTHVTTDVRPERNPNICPPASKSFDPLLNLPLAHIPVAVLLRMSLVSTPSGHKHLITHLCFSLVHYVIGAAT
jgi:hypothetical protein